jgi:hypothetical protein
MRAICLKLMLALLVTIVVSPQVFSMIREVPLNKLVHSSSIIVVANVEMVKQVGKNEMDLMVMANLLNIENAIKGEIKNGEKIRVKTFAGIEDLPTFKVGSKLLLFLVNKGTFYEVNYGIQGCWPIRNGKLDGMGTGKTIEDIKKEMAAPPLPEVKGEPFLL